MNNTDLVSLVLMNDEGHYRRIRHLTRMSSDVFQLESYIEDYCCEMICGQLDVLSELARELLVGAANEIDWREIALDLWTEDRDVTKEEAMAV